MSQVQAGADAPRVWSREALLESGPYAEPLVANGVRCHGGFDAEGRYRSPRTLHRAPAIAAWQARLACEGAPLLEVDRTATTLAEISGAGSQARRRDELASLFGRATDREQAFLRGLFLGELRQGALEGVMIDAVEKATGIQAAEVRRAAMVAGDLRVVAAAALAEGREALARFRLQVLQPIQPMLAQTADDVEDALSRISPASVEWKLDGARIQVHRAGDEVRAFTRNLADVTSRLSEVVEAVRALPVETVILDGEAIVLTDDGRPRPFQETMSRFGSRANVDEQRRRLPLTSFYFDLLHLNGEDLIDQPAGARLAALAAALPEELVVPRIETGHLETPSPFTPLGTKGAGAGGAVPAPACIASAVEDALSPLGVKITSLPLSPSRLRDLVQANTEYGISSTE